jgi:dephospho-CoA kinase
MFVIGLTGGIASGKSTVSQVLQEKSAYLLNADLVGHEAQQKGTEAWKEIVATWGEELIDPATRAIDRRKLGPIVFADPKALQTLNRIMWPRMHTMMEEKLADLAAEGVRVVVLEAALLIEAEWMDLTDDVWVTVVSEHSAVERLKARNGLSEEDALRRIRSQLSNEERAVHAQVIIDTECTLEEVKQKTRKLWESRVQGRV